MAGAGKGFGHACVRDDTRRYLLAGGGRDDQFNSLWDIATGHDRCAQGLVLADLLWRGREHRLSHCRQKAGITPSPQMRGATLIIRSANDRRLQSASHTPKANMKRAMTIKLIATGLDSMSAWDFRTPKNETMPKNRS